MAIILQKKKFYLIEYRVPPDSLRWTVKVDIGKSRWKKKLLLQGQYEWVIMAFGLKKILLRYFIEGRMKYLKI